MIHVTSDELHEGLDVIRRSPQDDGIVRLIVRRPEIGKREVLQQAELHPSIGVVGDNWRARGSSRTADGSSHSDMQINVMNSRVIDLIARDAARWPLAGDQLFVDLDLSVVNLPPGTRLTVGTAIIEATDQPHTGCAKFVERFGLAAMKFVNSPLGRELQLRGINARVVQGGIVRVGDVATKLQGRRS